MRVCAGGLLMREGRILLARRADDRPFYPGVWDVPGGHCEAAETPARALVRELEEEIGVTPTAFVELAVLAEPRPAEHGEARYHVFAVSGWAGGEPRLLGPEHAELRWLDLVEAQTLPLAHPDYLALFRRALAGGGPA